LSAGENANDERQASDAATAQAIAKAEAAFQARYADKAIPLAAPAEAVALGKLLRGKALKTDLGAMEKTERAVEALLPKRYAESLKELGTRFKAGGAAAYLAYLSCLCESWLIDPEPFARLERTEAKSLNDSASVRKTLKGIRDALSLQKSFLSHTGYLCYPPSFFLREGERKPDDDKAATECFDLFLSMDGEDSGDWSQAAVFMDQRIRSRLLDYVNFFALLPDSAFKRLAFRLGRPNAYPFKAPGSLGAEEDTENVEPALALIAEFESSLDSGKDEKKAESALALIKDRGACVILDSIPRYSERRKKLLGYWEGRISALATAAFPGKEKRVYSCLDHGSFNAVLVLKESDGGWSLPLGELDIVKKLKADSISKQDRLALARLEDAGRVISLSPLRVLADDQAAAFSWRFRLFGGLR
jgi:hypothetical protein